MNRAQLWKTLLLWGVVGVTVAILTILVLTVLRLPPGSILLKAFVEVAHPFLRIPVLGNRAAVAISIVFNGLYFALIGGFVHVCRTSKRSVIAASLLALVISRFILVGVFTLIEFSLSDHWLTSVLLHRTVYDALGRYSIRSRIVLATILVRRREKGDGSDQLLNRARSLAPSIGDF